ncbi:MAG: nucleoside deaminase, partial [Sphingomonas sp.]
RSFPIAWAAARIARLYYGASDPKGGAIEHGPRIFTQATIHHRPEIFPGIGETESAAMLRGFFANRR